MHAHTSKEMTNVESFQHHFLPSCRNPLLNIQARTTRRRTVEPKAEQNEQYSAGKLALSCAMQWQTAAASLRAGEGCSYAGWKLMKNWNHDTRPSTRAWVHLHLNDRFVTRRGKGRQGDSLKGAAASCNCSTSIGSSSSNNSEKSAFASALQTWEEFFLVHLLCHGRASANIKENRVLRGADARWYVAYVPCREGENWNVLSRVLCVCVCVCAVKVFIILAMATSERATEVKSKWRNSGNGSQTKEMG